VEVGDQLRPTVEEVDQRHQSVGTDQRRLRIDLDHRQPSASRGNRVTLAGVRLLPDPKRV
jgi:hypothetical protein